MGLPKYPLLWGVFIPFFFVDWEPAELKHLSKRRKRKKYFDIVSNGERKRCRTN